jgi:hypothetical protein
MTTEGVLWPEGASPGRWIKFRLEDGIERRGRIENVGNVEYLVMVPGYRFCVVRHEDAEVIQTPTPAEIRQLEQPGGTAPPTGPEAAAIDEEERPGDAVRARRLNRPPRDGA